MAKPGATQQPYSAAQHSPQMSIQIFEFQNIFFGPCVGGGGGGAVTPGYTS